MYVTGQERTEAQERMMKAVASTRKTTAEMRMRAEMEPAVATEACGVGLGGLGLGDVGVRVGLRHQHVARKPLRRRAVSATERRPEEGLKSYRQMKCGRVSRTRRPALRPCRWPLRGFPPCLLRQEYLKFCLLPNE